MLGPTRRDLLLPVSQSVTMSANAVGKLTIVVIEARGIKNTATLGTQDPYCSIQFVGKTVRTPTCDNGGTTPSTLFHVCVRSAVAALGGWGVCVRDASWREVSACSATVIASRTVAHVHVAPDVCVRCQRTDNVDCVSH